MTEAGRRTEFQRAAENLLCYELRHLNWRRLDAGLTRIANQTFSVFGDGTRRMVTVWEEGRIVACDGSTQRTIGSLRDLQAWAS